MTSKKKKKSKPACSLPADKRGELEAKLGHVFKDPSVLWEALQSSGNGVKQAGERKIEDGNKRMAMLGDSILQLALLEEWFAGGESRRVGHENSSKIACNKNLVKCGHENGLEKFINPNPAFRKGQIPPRTMAAAVEALIGAVFVDSGESLKAVKVAMKGLGLV